MHINRCKLSIVSLCLITICSWLLTLSVQAGSRGVSVISDLSHQSGKLGTYRALLIGINDYNDPKIPDLKTAVNDTSAMAKVLRERYGFQVKLLLNRKATREGIYRALRKLASSTKPDDSVLIYYAGHGDLDRTYDDGWWIPVDAKGGNPVTYLDNGQVQKAMRSMKARHVLLIADSCYSGTLFGQARAMPPVINDKYYLNLYKEKSRWGMTSGNKTPVSDRGTGGHSVFAYQLLKELRNSDKPYISTQELYTRIAPIIGNNSEQTPLCRPIRNTGDQGGEFVFVASSSAVVEEPATKPTESYLSIESNVSGAKVFVDGRYIGTTNLSGTKISIGEHSVRVEKDGYEPYSKRVRFKAGRSMSLTVVLDKKTAPKSSLYVETQPESARIRILNIGPAFYQGMELDAGRYHLEVSANGYETQKMWVPLTAGQDKTLNIHLDKTELRKETIEQLKSRREVTRGWLGVGIQDISEEVAEYYGIKEKNGVLVTELFPGGPADLAGIKPKDVILSVNRKAVDNARQLTGIFADISVGDTIQIEINRNGKTRTLDVKIAKREETKISSSPEVSQAKVIKRDGRFVAYANGTVKDTKTGLMWASKDNGENINWEDAKRYCENYRGGGYTDWRMPTQDELARLYDEYESYQVTQGSYTVYLTELIELSACCPWASETRGSNAAYYFLHFNGASRLWSHRSDSHNYRALPVRSGK